MENAETFDEFFKQFFTFYKETISAVHELRATPELRTIGLLKSSLNIIDETCSRVKESELKWSRKDFISQWMAIDGMIKHLMNVREEIEFFLKQEEKKKTTSGETSFQNFLEHYKRTIAYARDAILKAKHFNDECVVVSVRMIDDICGKTVTLVMDQKVFRALWMSVCGMVNHLKSVMNDFCKLEIYVPIYKRIWPSLVKIYKLAILVAEKYGTPQIKALAKGVIKVEGLIFGVLAIMNS